MKIRVITSILASSLLLLSGCNSSSGSSSNEDGSQVNNTGGSTTTQQSGAKLTINSENDAKKVVRAVSAVQFSSSLTSIGSSAQSTTSQQTQASTRQKYSQTTYCLDSGTITIDGEYNGMSSISLNYTFNNCVNKGVLQDGSLSMTGSMTNFTMNFNNFVVDGPASKLSMSGLTIKETMSLQGSPSSAPVAGNIEAVIDGSMDYLDKTNNNSGKLSYYSFASTFKFTTTKAEVTYNGDTAVTSSLYPCIDGTYSYKTLSPLSIPLGSNRIESGELEINDALFTFNNGEVVVTTKDGKSYTVDLDAAPSCDY